ncbi:hypothetical protein CASFOL_011586 [Castilleja foliolosa]|uniref:Uncharacterized protein n=1 Tax=Castilleja foliolosa TaxID=1961234 RepID=A0ABD3E013_9LAMI
MGFPGVIGRFQNTCKYLVNEEKMELLNEEQMEFDSPYGSLIKIRPAFKYLYAMKMLDFGIRGEKMFMEIQQHKMKYLPRRLSYNV